MSANQGQQTNHSKTVFKSVLAVVAMFGFGFALVPLYEVFCELTGINGKTNGRVEANRLDNLEADLSRSVRVQFITHNNESMPWQFKPMQYELVVHPGQMVEARFFARNRSNQEMTAQAVPSLSPSQGTNYFHKTECFCFNSQTLAANESIEMPLRFVVDPALPKELSVLTLSYTLFDISESAPAGAQVSTALSAGNKAGADKAKQALL